MNDVHRLSRMALDVEFKYGLAADRCPFRFKARPVSLPDPGGREQFAMLVSVHAAAELGAREVPALRWFADAGAGEKAAFGTNDRIRGFMDPEIPEIWLRQDLNNAILVETVAHETCHAIKHRGQRVSIEAETEAILFGRAIAAKWRASEESWAGLFVVESSRDLPLQANNSSIALCLDDFTLHRATGGLRTPRWRRYARLADQL